MSGAVPPRRSVLVGILRVAIGRADGIGCFGSSPQAFMASLAPLVGLTIVGAVLGMFSDGPRHALTGFGMTLCALLAPAVLSYELARLWKRSDTWIRFATAFNWCEWILPVLLCLAMVPMSLFIGAGVDEATAGAAVVIGLGCYGFWLQWFLASKALSLSGVRAALFVVLVNFGTCLIVIGPAALAPDP
jgi:hypothetical protein